MFGTTKPLTPTEASPVTTKVDDFLPEGVQVEPIPTEPTPTEPTPTLAKTELIRIREEIPDTNPFKHQLQKLLAEVIEKI